MLVILLGETGAGKTTIANELIARAPQVRRLKSVTTRSSRGPEDELWYDFVTTDAFDQMLGEGGLCEHTEYGNNAYGLPVAELIRSLVQPSVVALDHHGTAQVLQWFDELGLSDHVTAVHVNTADTTRLQRLEASRVNGHEVFQQRAAADEKLRVYADGLVLTGRCQRVANENERQRKQAVAKVKNLVERRHRAPDHVTTPETEEWYTPGYVFEALDETFDADVASPGPLPWVPAKLFLTKDSEPDGLTQLEHWAGLGGEHRPFVWMNPPYGRGIIRWTKAFLEHGHGVGLVFARAGTKWFQELQEKADVILFMPGRIAFCGPDGKPKAVSAPAGSVLFACGARGVAAVNRAQKQLGGVLVFRQHQEQQP